MEEGGGGDGGGWRWGWRRVGVEVEVGGGGRWSRMWEGVQEGGMTGGKNKEERN